MDFDADVGYSVVPAGYTLCLRHDIIVLNTER